MRFALYASADDRYVPTAVMALRSFQRWHPEFGYFILGTREAMHPESLALMQRYGIELIDVNDAHRFPVRGRFAYKDRERFYCLKGPELLAARGFSHSAQVDGDVFCPKPMDLAELGRLLDRTDGLAARPVGSLDRTLRHRYGDRNKEFDFSHRSVRRALGLGRLALWRHYEYGSGVLYFNNVAMVQRGFYEACIDVFTRCHGCFSGDQDLLAFTVATMRVPVQRIGHPFHFTFFEDSPWDDGVLRGQIDREDYHGVHVVHFVFAKPWLPIERPTPPKMHLVNLWRAFVRAELGSEATRYFAAIDPVDDPTPGKAVYQQRVTA